MTETSPPVTSDRTFDGAAREAKAQPILMIEAVERHFTSKRGDVAALGPVSFSVEEGTFVSIVGPSGCGKSTLLKILYGVIPPSSGTVLFHSQSLADHRSNVGMMFQSPVLLPWRSTLKNVLLPLEVLKRKDAAGVARARKLLEMVGVAEFADHYPRELSGGMQQRVAMCRTLVHDPEMLLLDEPFGALDSLTREQLNDDLLRIWSQTRKTVVFVTHDISEAVYLSDRVLVMSERPGIIRDEVRIDLPRPRDIETRRDPSFEEYGVRIRTALGLARHR
jgi:NitT/TauT family transport system ATP-binding protein